MNHLRLPIAALAALGITFGLFRVMYALISSGGDQRTGLEAISAIHFGPVEIPEEIMTRSRRETAKTTTAKRASATAPKCRWPRWTDRFRPCRG